jgi:hypothetical protein
MGFFSNITDVISYTFSRISEESSVGKKLVMTYFAPMGITSHVVFELLPESIQNKWISRGPVPLNFFVSTATGFQIIFAVPVTYGLIAGTCTSSIAVGIISAIGTGVAHIYLSNYARP